jgi:Arc/MetJ-type ribon-helix-helix transcriptional regulator
LVKEEKEMRLITLYLPEPYLRALDRLVNEEQKYPNRAEAIRLAVRDLLIVEAWKLPKFSIRAEKVAAPGLGMSYSALAIQEKIEDAQLQKKWHKYFWGGGRKEG